MPHGTALKVAPGRHRVRGFMSPDTLYRKMTENFWLTNAYHSIQHRLKRVFHWLNFPRFLTSIGTLCPPYWHTLSQPCLDHKLLIETLCRHRHIMSAPSAHFVPIVQRHKKRFFATLRRPYLCHILFDFNSVKSPEKTICNHFDLKSFRFTSGRPRETALKVAPGRHRVRG